MPPRYAHIGCCIDDSPAGAAALDTAVAMWREAEGRLSLVHVGPFPVEVQTIDAAGVFDRTDLNAAARTWLRRRARDAPGAEPVFLQGARGPAVCAWAEGATADLLVVGTSRPDEAPPGGFVTYLADNAACPVLVVRPAGAGNGDAPPLAPAASG